MFLFTGVGFGDLSSEQFDSGRISALQFLCLLYIINIGIMMAQTCRRTVLKLRKRIYKKKKCLCLLRLCPYKQTSDLDLKVLD